MAAASEDRLFIHPIPKAAIGCGPENGQKGLEANIRLT
jgi:hypothetical protein